MPLIAHLADWHIAPQGSRLANTGRNARLEDRYGCARFCIEDAVRRQAELIVHCGDLGNHWHWTPTIARLIKQALEPAREAGVDVLILQGNHDQVRNPHEFDALDHLRDLTGVHVIDRPCLLDAYLTGRNHIRLGEGGQCPTRDVQLQLACLPYPNPQLLLRDEETRNLSPGDRNLLIRAKLMDCARGLAADRLEGVPRILLGHFSVDVATTGPNARLMLLGGEWTINLQDLEGLGFDMICLGHIHRSQVLADDPWIGYSGSPEACSFSEQGEGKGFFMHEIGGPDA